MSLPLLEAMLPFSALAQTLDKARPNRMAFMFVPNGINMEHWTPAAEGANYVLPSTLEPLAGLKDQFNILTGLAQKHAFANGDGPGDHARSSAAWLTGVQPRKTAGTDIQVGISADQLAAQVVGNRTAFPSLELGCERGAQAGNCDSGYSCAYSSSISWRTESTPVAKEVNPRAVFERLFGKPAGGEDEDVRTRREKYRRSIIDIVAEDATALKMRLGLRDQRKMDEYLTSIREIEVRLDKMENAQSLAVKSGRPGGIPANYGDHIKLMGDMMVLAFQADLTRICTFMFANEGSNRSFANIGITDGHHDISHHGGAADKLEKKRQIDKFHMEQLAYVLNKMATTNELHGSLLDNSMVIYGGGISDGNRHNHDDLPILLAGKGAGTITTGRHIRYENGTPMNNLFLSMLDRVGVKAETLGDSTGKLGMLF
jgi:hypothetical protein